MNLQDFCGKHYYLEARGLDEPFSKGEWTYATDAVVCIRVPRLPEVQSEHGPDAGLLFDQAKDLAAWQPIPPVTVIESPCADCGGKGHLRVCNYCKGEGCKRCDLNGVVGCSADHLGAVECDECLGSGITKEGNIVMESSGGKVRLSAVYLDKIKDLPNVMIALPPSDDAKTAARIKFDGGEGLLMPMRL